MAVKKKGLGKGLDSLIPDNRPAKAEPAKEPAKEEVKAGEQMMNINMVEPNRDQPRKKFEEDALLELSDSIKQFGVIQPILVRKRKDYYEIFAGERTGVYRNTNSRSGTGTGSRGFGTSV